MASENDRSNWLILVHDDDVYNLKIEFGSTFNEHHSYIHTN